MGRRGSLVLRVRLDSQVCRASLELKAKLDPKAKKAPREARD